MGEFKINGTSILTCGEVISTSSVKGKSSAFSSGKLNVTGLSDSSKTIANAPAGYGWTTNLVGNKLKVNGVADTVSAKGCRPNAVKWDYFEVGTVSGAEDVYVTKETDGSIKADGTTVIAASNNVKYFYIVFQAPGGGGGSGKGGGGSAYGGGGGGGGAACIMRVYAPSAGTVVRINASYGRGDGGGAQSSSGSKPSGADGTSGGTFKIYNSAGTLVATLTGGGGGSSGWSDPSTGGGGGTFTQGTVPSGWKVWGKNGYDGTGGFKHNAPNDASWGTFGGGGSYSMSEDMPSGETTFSWTTQGGEKNGTKNDGGGGGGGAAVMPPFGSGKGGLGGYEGGSNSTVGTGRHGEPGAVSGSSGCGGGGGGAASTWTVPGGLGGWGGVGGIAIYY